MSDLNSCSGTTTNHVSISYNKPPPLCQDHASANINNISPPNQSQFESLSNNVSNNSNSKEVTPESLLSASGFNLNKDVLSKVGLTNISAGVLGGRVNLPGKATALVAVLPSFEMMGDLITDIQKKGIDNVDFSKALKGAPIYASLAANGRSIVGTANLGTGDIDFGLPLPPYKVELKGNDIILFGNGRAGIGKGSVNGGAFMTAKNNSSFFNGIDMKKFLGKMKEVQAKELSKVIDQATDLPTALKVPTNPASAAVIVIKEVGMHFAKKGAVSYYKDNSYGLIGVAGQLAAKFGQ